MIKDIIKLEADALARDYCIKEKERVRAIMERTAVDYYGQPYADLAIESGRLEYWLAFDPWLREALRYLPPGRALAVFESADHRVLSSRVSLLRYLVDPTVPFYTLKELADLAVEFKAHLERNRDMLVETGFPRTSFEKSKWLDEHLNHLYMTKLPVNPQANGLPNAKRLLELGEYAERDADGNIIYAYSWVDSCPLIGKLPGGKRGPNKGSQDGSAVIPTPPSPCGYANAPLITGLPPELAQRLEDGRQKFLRVKIEVIDALVNSIRNSETQKDIWTECLKILSKAFTREEVRSYLAADSELSELGVGDYLYSTYYGITDKNQWGGLSDLFHVIGHFEKEMTIGAFERTKTAICAQLQDLPESYYQIVGRPIQPQIDKVLDDFLQLEKQERAFWTEFEERVSKAVETDFDVEVTTAIRVRPEHAERFKVFIESFASWQATHLRETGKFASVDGSLQAGRLQVRLNRKQESDYRKNEYRCYDSVHFPGETPMKRSNMVEVNENPIRMPDHLLVLLLRLAEELIKGKGGWASRIDLGKEAIVSDTEGFQSYSNLRRVIEGSLLDKDGNKFIECDGSKRYRISTHPDFITYDKRKLLGHPDGRIKEIAERLPHRPK